MSGFQIGKKVNIEGITLDKLTEGASKKDEERIRSIFDKFNTTQAPEGEKDVLDRQEQVSLFAYLKKIAGDDDKITRKEAKAESNDKKLEYKGLKAFAKAILKLFNQNSKEIKCSENGGYTIETDDATEQYTSVGVYSGKTDSEGRVIEEQRGDYKFTHKYGEDGKHYVVVEDKNNNTCAYTVLDNDIYEDNDSNQYKFKNNQFVQIETPKSEENPTANNPASPQSADNPDKVEAPANNPASAQSADNPDKVEAPANNPPAASGERPKRHPIGKRSLATEWKQKRIYKKYPDVKKLGLENCTTAEDVANKLLEKYAPNAEGLQKEQLVKDLIYSNPSVFNSDGKVWDDPIWNNLDFPTNVGELYAAGKTTPKAPGAPSQVGTQDVTPQQGADNVQDTQTPAPAQSDLMQDKAQDLNGLQKQYGPIAQTSTPPENIDPANYTQTKYGIPMTHTGEKYTNAETGYTGIYENGRLTTIKDTNEKILFRNDNNSSSEYNIDFDKGNGSSILRDDKGKVIGFTTLVFKPTSDENSRITNYIAISRDLTNGNITGITEYLKDSNGVYLIQRNADGTIKYYQMNDDNGPKFNPDGTRYEEE